MSAFSKMAYGIYVLTTAVEDKMNGMIASWVSQVSYEPPLILAGRASEPIFPSIDSAKQVLCPACSCQRPERLFETLQGPRSHGKVFKY